jgi:hypothetical protein
VRLSRLEIASIFVRHGGLVFGGAANIGPTPAAGLLVGSSRVGSPLVIGGALALGLAAAAIGVW